MLSWTYLSNLRLGDKSENKLITQHITEHLLFSGNLMAMWELKIVYSKNKIVL